MDPVSVSGLALAGVSLSFQFFSACVKGYELLLKAESLPKKYETLRTRLQLEQYRFLDWATAANSNENPDDFENTWRIDREIVMDSLEKTKDLLLDLEKLERKFKLVLGHSEGELNERDNGIEEILPVKHSKIKIKALEYAARSSRFPKKLRWIAIVPEQFEHFLSELVELNDTMIHFLDSYQKKKHHELQESTYTQVLRSHNKLDDLVRLVESLGAVATATTSKQRVDKTHKCLAEFKGLSIAIESGRLLEWNAFFGFDPILSPELTQGKLALDQPSGGESIPCRSSGVYDGEAVWLEWKEYKLASQDSPSEYIEDRVSKLSILLRAGSALAEFNTPSCLGYVHQPDHQRFGFVFQFPSQSRANVPRSLYEMITKNTKPSLTARVELARMIATSLWYLHAANWVHKGVRSENIVFYDDSDISGPLLSGFEYSRPSREGEVTDQGAENRHHDLYRHADVQFDVPRDGMYGFKKMHDVYALGVVLYEIGTWQTIDRLLAIPPGNCIGRGAIKRVGSILLSQEYLERLTADIGYMFTQCARFCLEQRSSETVLTMELRNEDSLHREVEHRVIEVLNGIKI